MSGIALHLVKNICDNIKDDKMKLPKLLSSIAAAAVLVLASALPAEAAITTFFSAGTNCSGASNASFTTGGAAVKVSLCATTTLANEGVCGHTTYLSSAGGALEDNRFMVTARASGTAFTDNINATVNVLVFAPTSGNQDYGALANPLAPAAAPATLLLQTFDLTPQANATASSYVLSTGAGSILAVDTTGAVDCSGIAGVPSAGATFTMNLFVPPAQPAFTSANPPANATGTVNAVYGGHTFTATGNPAPVFNVTAGALPAGITLTAATGVLSGTPTAGGTFNFTVTASNGVGTAPTQNVQLVIAPASQTLTFNAQVPAAQLFSAGTFAINPLATSAAPNSGNAIAYSSTTLGVCTVSGTTVTIVAAGTCTIAANQAGNASYTLAAQVTQNVTINASAPAQPVAPIGSAGNATGTVTITAPNNGGSAITGYVVTCTPAGGTDTQANMTTLSHLITGLTNGTPYTCTVVATNGIGSSPASPPSNAFTPSLAPVAPAFTSPATLGGLTVGVAMAQFNITATGVPTPTITAGAAPSGLVFTSGGANSGTANITGTPTAAGTFSYMITAASTTLPNATQNLMITIAKGTRTINFAGPATPQAYSPTPVALSATTTPAGGTVTFSTASAGICSVSGTNVTMLAPGNCVIDANAATDANYLAAPVVTRTLVITQATQTITFNAQVSPRGFSSTPLAISPAASTTSGLAITYTGAGACTVTGATFTPTALGLCTITANQAGNANYSAAAPVSQGVTIVQGTQTISFGGLANVALGSPAIVITAMASSGLAVTFTTQTPAVCTATGVNGSTVNILALGICTIVANQAGNAFFAAAPPVSASFTVTPPGAVTLTTSNNPAGYRTPIVLTANINGTNPLGTVTFSISTNAGLVTVCGDVPVSSGRAICPVPAYLNVTHPTTYVAAYSGDGANPPNSASIQQLVFTDTVTLSVVSAPIQPTAGSNVVLKATVTGKNLSSKVAFNETGVALAGCSAVPVALLPGATDIGVASCTVPAITAGLHNYVVTYTHATDAGFEQVILPITPVVGAADSTDMWWVGPSENGWGVSITQHGRAQFIVLYVYDAFGQPIWYVLPQGTWNAGNTAFTGALYQPTSSPFSSYNSGAFLPGGATGASVGTATVTYTSANAATLTYTINGVSGSKSIVRQPFGTDDGLARMQVGDMWWAGIGENGWGMNIAQHNRVLFPVWYTYDNQGRTVFYAVTGGIWTGSSFTGDIYSTIGSVWLGANYNPAQFVVTKVGTMQLDFSDQSNAVMTYTVNGLTQKKIIMRQPYP